MKKTENKTDKVIKTETLKPIPTDAIDVVRTIAEDGKATYYHPLYGAKGEPLFTYSYNLAEYVHSEILNRIQSLINNMGDEVYEDFGYVFGGLLEVFDRHLDEIAGHMKAEGLTVSVDMACHGQIGYRPGQILGVRYDVEKSKENKQGANNGK